MKKHIVDQLIEDYPLYADQRLLDLPDGWLGVVYDLFRDLQLISHSHDESTEPVTLVEIYWRPYQWPSHLLFVKPVLDAQHWTPEMSNRLVQAVSRFNQNAPRKCEVCGQLSASLLKYQDGRRQQALCQVHLKERKWS